MTLIRIAASQRRYDYSIYTILALTWISVIVFCAGIAAICMPRPLRCKLAGTNVGQVNQSRHYGVRPRVHVTWR